MRRILKCFVSCIFLAFACKPTRPNRPNPHKSRPRYGSIYIQQVFKMCWWVGGWYDLNHQKESNSNFWVWADLSNSIFKEDPWKTDRPSVHIYVHYNTVWPKSLNLKILVVFKYKVLHAAVNIFYFCTKRAPIAF